MVYFIGFYVIGEEVNWVQCDRCEAWYHLLCVGLGEEEITEDEEYECFKCKNRDCPTSYIPPVVANHHTIEEDSDPPVLTIKTEPQDLTCHESMDSSNLTSSQGEAGGGSEDLPATNDLHDSNSEPPDIISSVQMNGETEIISDPVETVDNVDTVMKEISILNNDDTVETENSDITKENIVIEMDSCDPPTLPCSIETGRDSPQTNFPVSEAPIESVS